MWSRSPCARRTWSAIHQATWATATANSRSVPKSSVLDGSRMLAMPVFPPRLAVLFAVRSRRCAKRAWRCRAGHAGRADQQRGPRPGRRGRHPKPPPGRRAAAPSSRRWADAPTAAPTRRPSCSRPAARWCSSGARDSFRGVECWPRQRLDSDCAARRRAARGPVPRNDGAGAAGLRPPAPAPRLLLPTACGGCVPPRRRSRPCRCGGCRASRRTSASTLAGTAMSMHSGGSPGGALAATAHNSLGPRTASFAPVETNAAASGGGSRAKALRDKAWPPQLPASACARSNVRLTTTNGAPSSAKARAARVVIGDTPISATRPGARRSRVRTWPSATSASETEPAPRRVSVRTAAAMRSASSNSSLRPGPLNPAATACSWAARTCPATSASPRAAESSPAATRNKCSQAPSPCHALSARSASPASGGRPTSSAKASGRTSWGLPALWRRKTTSTRLQVSR